MEITRLSLVSRKQVTNKGPTVITLIMRGLILGPILKIGSQKRLLVSLLAATVLIARLV